MAATGARSTSRPLLRRAGLQPAGAHGGGAELRLCPAGDDRAHHCRWSTRWQWVWRHAAAHGGDARRIVVAGHSAGGHLAAMLLSCRWKQVADDLPAQPLAGALSISGLYDLEPLRHTPFLAGRPAGSRRPRCGARARPSSRGRKGRCTPPWGRRRERRVPAPEPADPRRLGPHRGAGVRNLARRQPLQRAGKPGRPRRPSARTGAAAAGPALTLCCHHRHHRCYGRIEALYWRGGPGFAKVPIRPGHRRRSLTDSHRSKTWA
jgi:hypothetical protein